MGQPQEHRMVIRPQSAEATRGVCFKNPVGAGENVGREATYVNPGLRQLVQSLKAPRLRADLARVQVEIHRGSPELKFQHR